MRLRNLFEALGNEVAIIFGRFNPPHKGHRAAWELASKSPIWFVGTNQSTVGPKDPLPYDIKVEAMKTIWPEVEGHIVAETSWLTLASKVYEKYPKATLLCLTDEDWVTKTIQQYNGKEGAHGYYNFAKIEQKPTPRLSSATALRDAVIKGDRNAFSAAAGVDADTDVAGKPFFDLVAEYLMPYQNAPKKVTRKKVAEPAESISEAPIEMDPQDPMNPMIYGTGANPGSLKYRMLRATRQLQDLAKRADNASASEWDTITRQFDELKMNVDQIRHGLDELRKLRSKGGIRSRGIENF
jgi:hypothetical protein